MALADQPLTLRVFLASPGDVPEERAYARELLESILPHDAFLPGRVTFDWRPRLACRC